MAQTGDIETPPQPVRRRGGFRSSSVTSLVTLGGVAGGAVLGVLPGVIARKTFLAPVPDAGLGDLGPALMALGLGAAGAVAGAIVGFRFTSRQLRRRSVPVAGTRVVGILVLLVVALPFAGVVFVIFPLGGLLLFAVLAVAAIVSFRPTRGRALPTRRRR